MSGLLDDMSDQDLRDLAAYFDQTDMPVGQASPDGIEQGRSLYKGATWPPMSPPVRRATAPKARATGRLAIPTSVARTPST